MFLLFIDFFHGRLQLKVQKECNIFTSMPRLLYRFGFCDEKIVVLSKIKQSREIIRGRSATSIKLYQVGENEV